MKEKIYFIAEIGVNHEANLKLAKKIIFDAKKGGADAVKLQSYKAEKIASKYAKAYWDKKEEREENQLKLYKRFDKFRNIDYEKIINYCKKIKIDFIITPFDLETIDFFKNKVKYFKISSSDITNFPLIEKIAKTKKPIILSTGASSSKEVKEAVNLIKRYNKKLTILHCILNYPTKRYDANLGMIDDLHKKFKLPVGLSDHTNPKDSHDILLFAAFKNITMIEKHFTNDKSKKGNDHFHSFDKFDLIKFNQKILDARRIIGKKKKNFLKSEIVSRKNARRSLFYNHDLKKNSTIHSSDIISLRPAIGISPIFFKKVIGKKIKIDVKSGINIKFSDFYK
tara:strand:+ start:3738 stop:4754 length:1017 start_codon:yes stop_codon:yes gene_type:complete